MNERDTLITEHKWLVISIAAEYFCHPALRDAREDIIQEGHLGLIKAADRYEAKNDATFGSFAAFHVRGHILDYLRDKYNVVRKPRNVPADECYINSLNNDEDLNQLTPKCHRPEPPERLLGEQTTEVMLSLIEGLPESYREIIRIKYWCDKSSEEVAEIMGVTPSRISQIETSCLNYLFRLIYKTEIGDGLI